MNGSAGDVVLLPLEKEVEERLSWLIRLRWVPGVALVLGGWFGLPLLRFPVPNWPFLSIGAGVLAYNLVLLRFGHRVSETLHSHRRMIHLQIGLDWAALTAVVYLTGGVRSPAAVMYVFHLILGSLLLSRRTCYVLTLAAVALMAALSPLTPLNLVYPVDGRPPGPPPGAPRAVEVWLALAGLFLATTYVATSITARLRKKEAALSRSERSLARALHGMESLHELGQLVNSTRDVNEILGLIARHATELLHGKASFIRLLDPTGTRLHIGGSFGLSRAYLHKGPVEVARSLVDAEALRGKIIQVLEVGDDRRFQYREEARLEGLRSMLTCPMRAKNRTLGVIRVYTGEPHVFDEPEEKLLLNLANLGAIAIRNAQSYAELREMDRERVWFARTTHHQLRAPLAAAQGAIDALPFAGELSDKQKDLVGRARRRILDAFDTIRDLLDLAAVERFAPAPHLEPVRVDESLRRVLETVEERCRAKNLELRVRIDPATDRLRAAPADLERIFSNLLDNAVKYTSRGGVALIVRSASGWVEAVVEDTGIGIAREDLERVFEGFYRTESAKASGEMGTGLGLSIVRKLVTKLSGTIVVESEPGRGSRFIVRLPAAAPLLDHDPQEDHSLSP